MMCVVRMEWHDDVAALAAEWEALARSAGAPPFAYPGWFAAWYDAFGSGRPQMLAAREEGELVAVVPLERRGGVLSAAANWHTPLYAAPVRPHALDEVARALLEVHVRRLDLTLLDPHDPLAAALRSPRCAERVVERQPWVDTRGSWDDFDAALPRKMRKELRRQGRRLGEQGEVRFEFRQGGDALDALLNEGFRVEGSGWKAERGTAIASDPAVERFYRNVAHWADQRGWLTLAFLRVDDTAVAFDMHLEPGRATYVLKGGFDPDWARFSPGSTLTYASLQRAFEDGDIQSYEFVGTDDAYKLSWTEDTRERVRLQLFPRTPVGSLERLAWTRARPVAKVALGLVGK
jgi:CelD/BcsL family acetyltransferase involved in cellulose biosynthesis